MEIHSESAESVPSVRKLHFTTHRFFCFVRRSTKLLDRVREFSKLLLCCVALLQGAFQVLCEVTGVATFGCLCSLGELLVLFLDLGNEFLLLCSMSICFRDLSLRAQPVVVTKVQVHAMDVTVNQPFASQRGVRAQRWRPSSGYLLQQAAALQLRKQPHHRAQQRDVQAP